MVTKANQHSRRLCDVLSQISDGDILLFKGTGLIARVIGIGGRSSYSHAAMAGWCGSSLLCMEVREFHGGRAVTLMSQVEKYPGKIDVYRPGCSLNEREKAMEAMRRKLGRGYSYFGILAAAALHLPVIRWFVRPDTSDDSSRDAGLPEFCSQAIASAYQEARVDLVPNLSNRLTEPGDLARSAVLRYKFTLYV